MSGASPQYASTLPSHAGFIAPMADSGVPASISGEPSCRLRSGSAGSALTSCGSSDVVPSPCFEASMYSSTESFGCWPKMIGVAASTARSLFDSW